MAPRKDNLKTALYQEEYGMVSKGIDSEAGLTWLPLLAPSLTAVSPQPQPLRALFFSVNRGDKSSTYSRGVVGRASQPPRCKASRSVLGSL